MRCSCCDKSLSDTEIVWNNDLKAYELCSTCLEIALDAAFSQGFTRPGEEIPVEVGDEFGDGIVESLDTDVNISETSPDNRWGDSTDITYFGGYDE